MQPAAEPQADAAPEVSSKPPLFPPAKAAAETPLASGQHSFGRVLMIHPPCYALIEQRQQPALLNLTVAERWLRQAQLNPPTEGLRPQPLLIPVKLTLDKREVAAIARHQALLTMMGLDLQADHGRVTLRAVPLPLRQQNLQKLIPELLGYLAEHQEMSPAVLATWLARRLGSEHEQWNTSQAIQLLTDVERLCPQLVKSPPSGLYNPLIYRLHWRPSSMTETEMTPRPRLFSSWGRPPRQDRAGDRAARTPAGGTDQRRFRADLSRHGYRHRQAERRRIGAGAASADRYSRSRRSLLGRGVPRRRAEGDGRHHRRRAHSAAGRRHHVVFQGVVGRIVAAAVRRSAVRERIERQAAEQGWEALHRQLQAIDPVAALRIHPNDPQRLSRALEVFYFG